MRQLRGRTAIVTGASRGIGAATAALLAREGVNLVLTARSAEALDAVAARARSHRVDVATCPVDLAVPGAPTEVARQALDAFGEVDLLVNNAGVLTPGDFARLDDHEIRETVDLNLTAGLLLTRLVLPGMLERRRGHVVMLGSAAAKAPPPSEAVYAATKAGQVAFAAGLRAQLRGSGVGVSAVLPGIVSDEGMFADAAQGTSVRVPWLTGSTTASDVARAVVRAIRRNRAEVTVNSMPLRPWFVLWEVSPRFRDWCVRVSGAASAYDRLGRKRQDRDSS